jgi:pimeloyl-ACP methyl ester carboxylesterase
VPAARTGAVLRAARPSLYAPSSYREAARNLPSFTRRALVTWGAADRMRTRPARRPAELLPHSRYVEVPGARTLIQLDDPEALTAVIRRFVRENRCPASTDGGARREGSRVAVHQ